MVLNLSEDYFSCKASSMSCLTEAYGCAPESGYFLPFGATMMLHGVPLPPIACAFCVSSSTCCAYFPLDRQVLNFCSSSPTKFAIFGKSAGLSPSFEGVISKILSAYFQNTSLLVPRGLEGPPCSVAHSIASASLSAFACSASRGKCRYTH